MQVCLARIRGAVGLRGEVRIDCYAEDVKSLVDYGPLTDGSGRVWDIRSVRPASGGAIARIKGVDDRDAALALRGTLLHIDRGSLPQAEEDEHYHVDLIGLEAVDAEGRKVGRVRAVHNFGAGDMLEVDRGDGAAGELVPFTREAVPEVTVERVVLAEPMARREG